MQKIKTYLAIVAVLFSMNSCIINEIHGQANVVIDQAEKDFDNVASLVVKGSFCSVGIDSHSSTDVKFRGEVKANKERDDIKIKYEQKGSTLEVWIERPKSLRGSFKGVLEFRVPANTNVKVNNSSGSVHVANLGQSTVELAASSGSVKAENIDSDLKVSASSGSLKVDNVSGNLHASCSSGSQSLVKIGGDVNASASSGSLKIEEVKGNVTSKCSSGSQHVKMVDGNVSATASSGSLRISDVNGDVKGVASSGSIKLVNVKGALNLVTSSGGQYGEGIYLTGNSSFKSSSGGISMDITNAADELSFDLTASSGGLSAKGTTGKKRLKIQKGDILIRGVSSSGGQRYR